jgi:hypothetical protein
MVEEDRVNAEASTQRCVQMPRVTGGVIASVADEDRSHGPRASC